MGVLSASPKTMDHCIEMCAKCARACHECFSLCLGEADVQARTQCIKTLVDCACICMTAVGYMSANSPHAKALCTLCAAICDACARECGMFKDAHCQECAKICQECAQACRDMAK